MAKGIIERNETGDKSNRFDKFKWDVNVTGRNSQTKTKVSALFDEGKAKCKAHCSINGSGCVHSDQDEYILKRVYIVGEHLTLTAHSDGNSLVMKKLHKHDASRIAFRL